MPGPGEGGIVPAVANAGAGMMTNFASSRGTLVTEPQVAAIFYILVIFLTIYIMTTFNLWSKVKQLNPSGFTSHMDSEKLTMLNANPTLNYASRQAATLGNQAYSGFQGRSHLTIPKGRGAIDNVLKSAAVGAY